MPTLHSGKAKQKELREKLANKHFYKGNEYFTQQQYEEAIKEYDKAIELFPENFNFRFNRCSTYLELDNLASAQKDMDVIFPESMRTPQNSEAYYTRGLLRLKQKNYAAAIQDLTHFINNPSHNGEQNNKTLSDAYYNLALAYKSQNPRDNDIAKNLVMAIKKNPSNDKAYIEYGNYFSSTNRPDEAVAQYDEALRINPKSEAAEINKALLGKGADAIEMVEEFNRQLASGRKQYIMQAPEAGAVNPIIRLEPAPKNTPPNMLFSPQATTGDNYLYGTLALGLTFFGAAIAYSKGWFCCSTRPHARERQTPTHLRR